jgi:hypothetical protein
MAGRSRSRVVGHSQGRQLLEAPGSSCASVRTLSYVEPWTENMGYEKQIGVDAAGHRAWNLAELVMIGGGRGDPTREAGAAKAHKSDSDDDGNSTLRAGLRVHGQCEGNSQTAQGR